MRPSLSRFLQAVEIPNDDLLNDLENIFAVKTFAGGVANIARSLASNERFGKVSSTLFAEDNPSLAEDNPSLKHFEKESFRFHMSNIFDFMKLRLFNEEDKKAIQDMIDTGKWTLEFFKKKEINAKNAFLEALDWTLLDNRIRDHLRDNSFGFDAKIFFDSEIKRWKEGSIEENVFLYENKTTVEQVIHDVSYAMCERLEKSIQASLTMFPQEERLLEKEKMGAKIKQRLISTTITSGICNEKNVDGYNKIRELLVYLSSHRAFLAHELMQTKEASDFIALGNVSAEKRLAFITENIESLIGRDGFSTVNEQTTLIKKWTVKLGDTTSVEKSTEDFFIDLLGFCPFSYRKHLGKNALCYDRKGLEDTAKLSALYENQDLVTILLKDCLKERHQLETALLKARSTNKTIKCIVEESRAIIIL